MGHEHERPAGTAVRARRCPNCALEAPARYRDIGFDLHSYECVVCGCSWMTDRRTGSMVGHIMPKFMKKTN